MSGWAVTPAISTTAGPGRTIPPSTNTAQPSLAAASRALKGWNDPLAKECLDTAIKLWNDEEKHPAPNPFRGGFATRFGSPEWPAALELLIATNGAEPYKQRVEEAVPRNAQEHGLPRLDRGAGVALPRPELQNPIQIRASGVAAAVRSPATANCGSHA